MKIKPYASSSFLIVTSVFISLIGMAFPVNSDELVKIPCPASIAKIGHFALVGSNLFVYDNYRGSSFRSKSMGASWSPLDSGVWFGIYRTDSAIYYHRLENLTSMLRIPKQGKDDSLEGFDWVVKQFIETGKRLYSISSYNVGNKNFDYLFTMEKGVSHWNRVYSAEIYHNIFSIAADQNRVLMLTNYGQNFPYENILLFSNDGGNNWEKILFPAIGSVIGSDYSSPMDIWGLYYAGGYFIATTNMGLYEAKDPTQGWQPLWLSGRKIKHITAEGDNLVASDSVNLFSSPDRGLHWFTLKTPFSAVNLTDIQLSNGSLCIADGDSLYCGLISRLSVIPLGVRRAIQPKTESKGFRFKSGGIIIDRNKKSLKINGRIIKP